MRRAAKVERENEKASEKASSAKKAEDDHYWASHGDGTKSKAAQRAEADAAAADAKAAARADARRQAAMEEEQFSGKIPGTQVKKKTAYELAQGKEAEAKERLKAKFAAAKAAKNEIVEDEYASIVDRENDNRARPAVSASGIDAAIEALSLEDSRSNSPAPVSMKAAYERFEEEKLADLKQEKPGLKMSQYRDLLSKLWARDPRNPLNQRK